MAQCHQPQHQHEFLPLCDVLFNIISLASYFCDVVFDFAMVYALAHQAIAPALFPLSITFIATSLLISQVSIWINNNRFYNVYLSFLLLSLHYFYRLLVCDGIFGELEVN